MAAQTRMRWSYPLGNFSLGLSLLAILDTPHSVSSTTRTRSILAVSLGLQPCNQGALESPPDLLLPRWCSSLSEEAIQSASVRPNEGVSEAKHDVTSVVVVLVVPNLPPFALPWLLTRLRLDSSRLEKVVLSVKYSTQRSAPFRSPTAENDERVSLLEGWTTDSGPPAIRGSSRRKWKASDEFCRS